MGKNIAIMEGSKILNSIISKGGLMAACAKLYVNDKEKAELFLKECYGQCHTVLAEKYWGKTLVKDIINYNRNYEHGVKHN